MVYNGSTEKGMWVRCLRSENFNILRLKWIGALGIKELGGFMC